MVQLSNHAIEQPANVRIGATIQWEKPNKPPQQGVLAGFVHQDPTYSVAAIYAEDGTLCYIPWEYVKQTVPPVNQETAPLASESFFAKYLHVPTASRLPEWTSKYARPDVAQALALAQVFQTKEQQLRGWDVLLQDFLNVHRYELDTYEYRQLGFLLEQEQRIMQLGLSCNDNTGHEWDSCQELLTVGAVVGVLAENTSSERFATYPYTANDPDHPPVNIYVVKSLQQCREQMSRITWNHTPDTFGREIARLIYDNGTQ